MTVSTTTSRVRYEGDGATSVFPIPFKFVDNAHVRVTLRDAASQETPWTEGSDYALSGAGNDGGGTLTVLTEPVDKRPRAGETLVIALDLPFTQDKAFPLGGAFPTTQVEEGLDLAALRDAQLAAFDARALSVPATDAQVGGLELPIDALRAGRYLGFDAQGKPALLAGTAEAADLSDKTVLPTGAAGARSLADLFGLGALTAENVKLHGAKGDLVELADGTVTDGSAVLSSAGIAFDSADVGKAIWVEGCSTTGKTISAIANGPADAAWQWDASADAYVDETDDFVSAGAGDVEPFPASEAVGDRFYIGHIQTFDQVTITIGTSGVGGAVQWKYWDGTAWQNLTVTDNTSGFAAAAGSHTVTFTPPVDWATTQLNSPINGRRLYYIAAEVTTVYTTNPVLDQGVLDGGRIRVTSALHLVEPLQTITIKGVVGTTEANGTWQVERIDNDVIDLIGPSFQNAYVSGGTIHGRLETTIAAVSAGDATLAANAGAAISGTAAFGYGTDDTAAIQAAIDTGKAVLVTDGRYFSDQVVIDTDGQKLLGMGGEIVALPAALTGADGGRYPLVAVEANFVEVAGLRLDNPSLQSTKGDSWPDSINSGLGIKGFQCNVHDNFIRRFRDGINVQTSDGFFTGPEYANNIIANNIVWELLGSGSGSEQREGIQGEASGDGIVSWGAATIITGNIVNARVGADCRIALHVEALADRYDPDDPTALYVDSGAVISGNIVLAHGLAVRNGRFRRSITTEQVRDVSIADNVIYGGGWAGIEASLTTDDDDGPKGNVAISGNVIRWTRPDVDRSGLDWSPSKSAISIRSNSGTATRGAINVAISGNTVELKGMADHSLIIKPFIIGALEANISVTGNTFLNRTGIQFQFVNTTNGVQELVFSGNTFRGSCTSVGVRIQNGADKLVFANNTIELDQGGSHGLQVSNGVDNIITGNSIDGPAADGIQVINASRAIVTGNVIRNCGDDGIDGFGTTERLLANNIFSGIGNLYTRNWTPGATVLDVNNIKN